jgi:nucleoside-diphosphate-sugar epimerase
MKDNCPNAHLITLGTMGEYQHDIGVDIEEGYFEITKVDGQRSKESIFPRRPGSIYHTSKTASTYLIDLLVRSWGLKVTDIMQGVVVGLYVNDTPDVSSFWIDEAFGTVVNRFCAQATINEPLTVFGSGNHSRTFLTLQDSIQALLIAINNPPTDTSKPRVWNQLTEHWKIIDLANYINEKTNCDINHIDSPRTENTEKHYYNVKTDVLNSLGYKPSRTIKEEIDFLLSLLPRFKDNIESQKQLILPNIKW